MKRVVTKIGDIFCVETEGSYKSYFQYITTDMTMLNSTVIRVFKKRYPIDYIPDMDEIVRDEVYFYAHTILRVGLHAEAWYKVGKHKDIGDTEHIMFRLFSEGNFGHMTKSHNWRIWMINQPTVFIGDMREEYKQYNMGWIYPYASIVAKIRTGDFLIKNLE